MGVYRVCMCSNGRFHGPGRFFSRIRLRGRDVTLFVQHKSCHIPNMLLRRHCWEVEFL
eukprot:COSAG01_NODE_491_length_16354_cov_26.550784_10_plen_58_part_00